MEDADLKELVSVVSQYKGEMIYFNALIMALVRVLPPESQGSFFRELDSRIEAARSWMAEMEKSEAMKFGFEGSVRNLDRELDRESSPCGRWPTP